MIEKLKKLHEARLAANLAAEEKKKFLATQEAEKVFAKAKETKEAVAKLESELREYAVGVPVEERDSLIGIKFRKRRSFSFSIHKATEWCKTNFPAALTVDKKKFETYIKAADELPDFVVIKESEIATIPTDLSKFI